MAVQIAKLDESLHTDQAREEDAANDDYGFFRGTDHDSTTIDDDAILQVPMKGSTSSSTTESTSSSTTTSSQRRIRSSLKLGTSYGKDEGIPLAFTKRKFNRVLPIPSNLLSQGTKCDTTKVIKIPTRHSMPVQGSGGHALLGKKARHGGKGGGGSSSSKMFRVSSDTVLVRPVYANDDFNDDDDDEVSLEAIETTRSTTTTTPSKEQSQPQEETKEDAAGVPSSSPRGMGKRSISFGTIQIREHSLTCGDNPSVSYGTPLSLDWLSEDMEAIDVEDYEEYRSSPDYAVRTKRELMLNYYQRNDLLEANGCTPQEILEMKKEVKKIKSQREFTKFMVSNYRFVPLLEDFLESGARKVKRVASFSKKNGSTATTASIDSIHRSKPYATTQFE